MLSIAPGVAAVSPLLRPITTLLGRTNTFESSEASDIAHIKGTIMVCQQLLNKQTTD